MTEEQPDRTVTRLVLAPYLGHWEISDYPTSSVVRAMCGHLTWASHLAVDEMHKNPSHYTICMPCHRADSKKGAEEHLISGGTQALRDLHGDRADEMIETARRMGWRTETDS